VEAVTGRVTVTLRKPGGDLRVFALPTTVPGLLVAHDPEYDFVLIHHSGVGVGLDFASPEAALACAQELAGVIDWSADVQTVSAQLEADRAAARAVVEAGHRWGGNARGTAPETSQLSAWSAS
jgi:hypothetical protein